MSINNRLSNLPKVFESEARLDGSGFKNSVLSSNSTVFVYNEKYPFKSNTETQTEEIVTSKSPDFTVYFIALTVFPLVICLCCTCKAYLWCKARHDMENGWDENIDDNDNATPCLSSRYRYSDKPPSYDDVLSGRVLTLSVTSLEELAKRTNVETLFNLNEIRLFENVQTEPPPYDFDASTAGNFSGMQDKIQPPSYKYCSSFLPFSGRKKSLTRIQKRAKRVILKHAESLPSISLHTISSIVSSKNDGKISTEKKTPKRHSNPNSTAHSQDCTPTRATSDP